MGIPGRHLMDNLGGPVIRAVVYDDDLMGKAQDPLQGFQGLSNRLLLVERRDDDGELGIFRHHTPLHERQPPLHPAGLRDGEREILIHCLGKKRKLRKKPLFKRREAAQASPQCFLLKDSAPFLRQPLAEPGQKALGVLGRCRLRWPPSDSLQPASLRYVPANERLACASPTKPSVGQKGANPTSYALLCSKRPNIGLVKGNIGCDLSEDAEATGENFFLDRPVGPRYVLRPGQSFVR